MDLDLNGIMEKFRIVLPYISYLITLMNSLFDMFSAYLGVTLPKLPDAEQQPEE